MKEAAGEANITVITIVLIAIVLAVGTIVVNSVLNNTNKSSACTSAGGYYSGGTCYSDNAHTTTMKCCKAQADGKNAYEGIKKGEWYCGSLAEKNTNCKS